MKLAKLKGARSIFAGLLLLFLALAGITSEGFSADSILYHYDAIDRLEQVVYPDGTNILYAYDNVGNRLSQNVYQIVVSLFCESASEIDPHRHPVVTHALIEISIINQLIRGNEDGSLLDADYIQRRVKFQFRSTPSEQEPHPRPRRERSPCMGCGPFRSSASCARRP